MTSSVARGEDTLLKELEDRLNTAVVLDDTKGGRAPRNGATRALTEDELPFVFFDVAEIRKFTKSTMPRARRVKTCGVFKCGDRFAGLFDPHTVADDSQVLEVDIELVGEYPQVGILMEVFGYVQCEETSDNVKFSAWFWRRRIGSYKDLVKLQKYLRLVKCQRLL